MHTFTTLAILATTTDAPEFDSNGVILWAVKTLVPLILLVIGIGIIASARGGRLSDNGNTITNVMLGLGLIAGAGLLYGFAGQLVNLAFGG